MQGGKIETVQGLCVVALTRHLMNKYLLAEDEAYAKLIDTELYSLLMDPETLLQAQGPHRILIIIVCTDHGFLLVYDTGLFLSALFQSLLKRSLVYTFSCTSSSTDS